MARILIGPDGGPYVKLEETNGKLQIDTPNGTIDLTGDALTNGDLQITHSSTHESGGSDEIDSGQLAANSEFQLYAVSTDPSSPDVGTIWYREDLD